MVVLFLFSSCSKDSDNSPEPDTTVPQVSFAIAGIPIVAGTIPVVSQQIQINVSASDAGGIQKIEAFINDQKKGEDSSAPYELTIDLTGYTSKGPSGAKYQDYTLRVVATDKAGNSSSQELTINIDNEMPVIADVSLSAGSILGGDTNEVTFTASDNEALTALEVYLNDELITSFSAPPYVFNINTLEMEDGPNTVLIHAEDAAANVADYTIPFVADNTGPEITLESVLEGQVIDSLLLFAPTVSDAYSQIVSFKATLNGVEILQSISEAVTPLEFNPETLPVGEAIFALTAEDALGNTTSQIINAQIKRRLFKASFESGFMETNWIGFWILISELDGSFISLTAVPFDAEAVTVHAPGEFAPEKEYMATFITEENHGSWRQPHITNVQNISRDNFTQMNFKARYGEGLVSNSVPLSGFFGVEIIEGFGDAFQITTDNEITQLNADFYTGNGYGDYSSVFLIGYELGENPNEYGYFEWVNPQNTTAPIQRSDFITGNTSRGTIDYSSNDLTTEDKSLYIYGYKDQQALDNNVGHRLFNGDRVFGFSGSIDYAYPDVFQYYKHHFRLNNYNTYREGLPLASYTAPAWNLDLALSGNEIVATATGDGFVAGRIQLEIGNSAPGSIITGSITMSMIFNPTAPGSIYIPQIPEELNILANYDVFQSGSYSITNGDLTGFNTISSYADYLERVVSPYKEHTEVAPVMENTLYQNGFIFPMWSFKYFH